MLAYLKSLLLILLTFFATKNLYPQNEDIIQGSPEWLIDMYFIQTQFPGKASYYTGGMIGESEHPTIGEELEGNANISYHKILSANSKSVFAI